MALLFEVIFLVIGFAMLVKRSDWFVDGAFDVPADQRRNMQTQVANTKDF